MLKSKKMLIAMWRKHNPELEQTIACSVCIYTTTQSPGALINPNASKESIENIIRSMKTPEILDKVYV